MSIILYSYGYCPYSQRCRIVFCEKDMDFELREININDKPPELSIYNPYNQVPTLIDRDMCIHESNIINEYLDDRLPHPHLMPTDIMLRARMRLLLYKLDEEIFPYLRKLVLNRNLKKQMAENARKRIAEGLTRLLDVLPTNQSNFSDKEFTMLDVVLAPLLWRLKYYNIVLPARVEKIWFRYAERIFSRPSFIKSMSIAERAMRK